jgi:hypothetical protein
MRVITLIRADFNVPKVDREADVVMQSGEGPQQDLVGLHIKTKLVVLSVYNMYVVIGIYSNNNKVMFPTSQSLSQALHLATTDQFQYSLAFLHYSLLLLFHQWILRPER